MKLISYEKSEFNLNVQHSFDSRLGHLELKYEIHGPIELLKLDPPKSLPQFKDELWKATCFEVFLRNSKSKNYLEWNFSPSGDWAYFEFEDYRSLSKKQGLAKIPNIQQNVGKDFYSYLVKIEITRSVNEFHPCAILTLKDKNKEHWCLQTQTPRPDFHSTSLFTKLDI